MSQEDAADPRFRQVARNGGGLVVAEVAPDGPAYGKLFAASENQGGPDIILQVNGTAVRSRSEFRTALSHVKTGDIVDLLVYRNGPDGWAQQFVRIKAR